ncbi:UV DNA damage repair endonuclease UvsE [Persicitalea jodogahamensis]|uniref:UV DNA damage endonuclease n=1 Tax=Persicitalea jodogahamensis TaxID=402147 RepID=A0A8J3D514_9BACT|nr:UV DNA damage repair endonuclease UvsE [Persicitalea jodogahamensis]GHB76328.1 UV DNA damage endonuclease [Persicitalea jodogahamensis]
MRIGYACINMFLAENKITVNRSMVKKTFLAKGPAYASELALKNVTDLENITDWNIENKLLLYRMSSDMFPWMSEYEFSDLPDIAAIREVLSRIGKKAQTADLRLTFHPGPFNVLASKSADVLRKTNKELRQHGEIMDMLGLPRSPFAKINLHVGGAYGDKASAIDRFCANYQLLSDTARLRLTVENDDRGNLFTTEDLVEAHRRSGIPVVFDYHHHQLNPGEWGEERAMAAATSTWPTGITPIVHYSSSRRAFEEPLVSQVAHADYVYDFIDLYGREADIMLEAKAKEQAVLRYLKEFPARIDRQTAR